MIPNAIQLSMLQIQLLNKYIIIFFRTEFWVTTKKVLYKYI